MERQLMILVCLCVGTTCGKGGGGVQPGKNGKYGVTCSWTPSRNVSCTFVKLTGGVSRNSVFCRNVSLSNDCTKLTIEVCFCQQRGNCTMVDLPIRKIKRTMTRNCEGSDCTQTCRRNSTCQIRVPVKHCFKDTDDIGSGFGTSISSNDLVMTTKATITKDTHGPHGEGRQFIGIGIGIGLLVLITLAILVVVLHRGRHHERSHVYGVNWDDQGYMGVEIKRRPPQRRADVTGQVGTDGFNNQTYEDEIAVGIRGGSNRTIVPVVPPVPASPDGVPLTQEGYVEYNPKSDQGENPRTASGGGLMKRQWRPLPAPNTAGTYEGPYEEIKDLVTSGCSASSAELPTLSTSPQQVGSSGQNTPIQASVDRSRSTGYVDVDYPDTVFETTLGSDGKNPCSVDETTSTEKASVDRSRSTGHVDVDYPDPVFETIHGSDGKNTCPVGKTTPNENASVHPSRSTGYVDVDYPDPVFETTLGSDGNGPCPVDETTPNEKCDGHQTDESAMLTYFILEKSPIEPKLTDSEKPAQSGGTLGCDGPEKPGVPFEVATVADGKSRGKATVNRASSPVAGLTESPKMGKRQTRSLTSAYNQLDRGPLWRKVTK